MTTHRLTLALSAALTPAVAQTDWTLLAPPASPPAFTAHTMTYFPPTDRTVLFGGLVGNVRFDQTWLFDGAAWIQAAPATVPPARVAHAMAYDPFRARLVMFGGIPAAGGLLGDTWEWDGFNWIAMTPVNSPTARRSFPMAFYPPRGTVVLWGGFTTQDLNDTWEWNGVDWTQIATANSPGPRRASDMAYDPVNGTLVLFSGYQQSNDTWTFNGVDWTLQSPSTNPPARYDHSMVTDPVRGRIVMFGGPGAADTWEWDGTDWLSRGTTTLPAARLDTYLAFDSLRNEVLMFGSSVMPETWRYAPTFAATVAYAGAGCAGSLGAAPQLSTSDLPWLAESFALDVGPVPANTIGLMAFGLSNTTSGLGPLPASLAAIGMVGCTLQVDPVLIDAFLAVGVNATWIRSIPNDPLLLGQAIYCQGAAVAPGANPANLIVSDHARLRIGGK